MIRRAISALATAAILGGATAGLIWWAGWPLPDHWPTSEEWITFADEPLTPAVLKALAACGGWLVLLALAAALLIQGWAQASRRTLRLPRPVQVVTAGLLGVGVFNLAASPAHADPPPSTPASAPADQPPAPAHARADIAASEPGATPALAVRRTAHDGIDLPGGWITWGVATGILAVTASSLLRGQGWPRTPPLLRAIRTAQHPTADPADEEEPPTPTPIDDVAAQEKAARTDVALSLGTRGGNHLAADAMPRSGVGFTGAGADDALRGLLAGVASSSQPATAILAQPMWARLTEATTPHHRWSVVADISAALHAAQLEISHRYTAGTGSATAPAPLLVITGPPSDATRLRALAELGHDLNVYVVVSGPWLQGSTWRIDPHGNTSDGPVPIGRLNVVNRETFDGLSRLLQGGPQWHNCAAPAPAADDQTKQRTAPQLHLRILGRPDLRKASEAANIHIRRSGSWQIACYLALHPDGASREELLEQICGHLTRAKALTTLNSCIYDLRRALRAEGRSALLTTDDGYRLEPDLIDVDWWQLQAHLRHGNLDAAIALYRGQIADGHSWNWLPEHRQTARHQIADTRTLLSSASDTPAQALAHALAGLDVDPYSERCYAAAIKAYEALNNPAAAQHLDDELHQKLRLLRHA